MQHGPERAKADARRQTTHLEPFATNLFDERCVMNSGVQCLESTCGDPGNVSKTGSVFYGYVIRPRVIGVKAGFDF